MPTTVVDEVCKSYQTLIESLIANQKAIFHHYKVIQQNPSLSLKVLECHYANIQIEYKRIQELEEDIKNKLLIDTFVAILGVESSDEAKVHRVLCRLFTNVHSTFNLIVEVKKSLLRMIQKHYKKPITNKWIIDVLNEAIQKEEEDLIKLKCADQNRNGTESKDNEEEMNVSSTKVTSEQQKPKQTKTKEEILIINK